METADAAKYAIGALEATAAHEKYEKDLPKGLSYCLEGVETDLGSSDDTVEEVVIAVPATAGADGDDGSCLLVNWEILVKLAWRLKINLINQILIAM